MIGGDGPPVEVTEADDDTAEPDENDAERDEDDDTGPNIQERLKG